MPISLMIGLYERKTYEDEEDDVELEELEVVDEVSEDGEGVGDGGLGVEEDEVGEGRVDGLGVVEGVGEVTEDGPCGVSDGLGRETTESESD